MTGDIEAAADAATGVALARAVEPSQGEAGRSAGAVAACLNCAAPLAGRYCSQCGQVASVHRSFLAIWHDFLHSALHFDGKVWRTLPELALRPGQLTRRYIHGERAKFVSPLALFLFSVFFMFAASALVGEDRQVLAVNDSKQVDAAVRDEAIKAADQAIAEARAALEAAGLDPEVQSRLQSAGAQERRSTTWLDSWLAIYRGEGVDETSGLLKRTLAKFGRNPDLINYKLMTNAYKFSWALILISIPFVWLLFPFRREVGLYDHAIFVTYSIAFVSLLFSLTTVLPVLGVSTNLSALVLFVVIPWHMYRQLKDAYSLTQSGALLRLPLLYLSAALCATLFLVLLAVLA